MPTIDAVLPHLVHLGAILYLVCFLFRNQIMLRCFAIFGDIAYIAYYYGVSETPLWEAMFYAAMNIAINFAMIYLVLRDRRAGHFSEQDLQLFRSFSPLSPGEFRRLMQLGSWTDAESDAQLTVEGKELDKLHYVLSGDIEIEKSGRHIKPDAGIFIGEIAFLSRKPATAKVVAKTGARYLTWDSAALHKLLQKDHSLQQGLMQVLSADLAGKVARS